MSQVKAPPCLSGRKRVHKASQERDHDEMIGNPSSEENNRAERLIEYPGALSHVVRRRIWSRGGTCYPSRSARAIQRPLAPHVGPCCERVLRIYVIGTVGSPAIGLSLDMRVENSGRRLVSEVSGSCFVDSSRQVSFAAQSATSRGSNRTRVVDSNLGPPGSRRTKIGVNRCRTP
jgi:hypothetical protein